LRTSQVLVQRMDEARQQNSKNKKKRG
jgi:hypothetical protein